MTLSPLPLLGTFYAFCSDLLPCFLSLSGGGGHTLFLCDNSNKIVWRNPNEPSGQPDNSKDSELLFIKHLLYARHWDRHFLFIISLNPLQWPLGMTFVFALILKVRKQDSAVLSHLLHW